MPKQTPEECSGCSCPFACTGESEYAQNTGCLPTINEIIAMRIEYNKTWACHSDISKPCLGAIRYLKAAGMPYKVVDKSLVTEDDDFNVYPPTHWHIKSEYL